MKYPYIIASDNQRGVSLVGLIIGIALIVLLYLYLPKLISLSMDKDTKKILKDQGVEVGSYKEMVNSAKKTAAKLEKIMDEREKLLEFGK